MDDIRAPSGFQSTHRSCDEALKGRGGAARILVETAKHAWAEAAYSPDGTWLLLRSYDSTNVARRHIYARRTSADTTLRELVVSTGDDSTPAFSPDGRWLAKHRTKQGEMRSMCAHSRTPRTPSTRSR